ncbi:MAG: hypothetical protein IKU04_05700 [Bacteroidales bacterium]|nr:hypothetical protein [Bacteroidales bacterium]
MKEEDVTKKILQWLVTAGWDIICFDFPQSGTGRPLHPNNRTSKTEGVIIPDIVALKNGIVLDFENKDRFVLSDFEKLLALKTTNNYSDDWESLLKGKTYEHIFYGAGIPYTRNNFKKAEKVAYMADFIVYLKVDGSFLVTDNIGGLFQ